MYSRGSAKSTKEMIEVTLILYKLITISNLTDKWDDVIHLSHRKLRR